MPSRTDEIKAELLKRLDFMENSWEDLRVTSRVTVRERQLALTTIARFRQHVKAAFNGEILEGKPIQR